MKPRATVLARAALAALIIPMCGCGGSARESLPAGVRPGFVEGWTTLKGGPGRTGEASARVLRGLSVFWRHTVEGASNGFADWGPVAHRGVVYAPNGGNELLALDAAGGDLLWRRPLPSNVFSVSVGPEGELYATTAITTRPSPTLYRLDAASGALVWDNMASGQDAIGGIEGPPAVDGDSVYVGYLRFNGAGGVCAYGRDGRLLWRWAREGHSALTPVAAGSGRVIVGFDDGHYYCLRGYDGHVQWDLGPLSEPPMAAPVVRDRKAYLAAGDELRAVALDDGAPLWNRWLEGQTAFSSPVVTEDRVYQTTDLGWVYCLDRRSGAVVWRTRVDGGKLFSSPVHAAGLLYFGSEADRLYVLDAASGALVERIQLGGHPSGNWRNSPAIYGGWIYIGSLGKTLYALRGSGTVDGSML